MTDKEQRAHDIATALLPKALKKHKIKPYTFDENGIGTFHNIEITEEYWSIYEAILEQLPD